MKQINRRELMKTTAAGVGVALGAGAASGGDGTSKTSGPVGSDQTLVSTVGAEATAARVAIDTDPSEFANNPDQVLQEINTDQPLVTITDGEIYEDGTLTVDDGNIAVPDLIDILLALDPKQLILDFINGLDIYADVINEYNFENLKQQLIDFIDGLGVTDEQVTAVENLLNVLDSEFDLGIPVSLIPFDTLLQTPEDGIPELINLIESLADNVEEINDMLSLMKGIVGLVNSIVIDDPANELEGVEDLLPFVADQVAALNLENILGLLNITVTSTPIDGTVDPDKDPLEMEVPLEGPELKVELDTVDGPDPVFVQFDQLSVTLTTGTSGNLAGDFTPDTAADTATAVVVDNEFTANITEFDLTGLVQKLNLEELITALFDLANIDPAEYPDFDIPTFVSNIDLPTLVENANLLELIDNLIQDESGRHAIEADLDMTFQDLQAVYDQVELGPDALPGNDPPTDVDGDGAYEDVDGNKDFDIFDVQTLFNGLESEPVQSSPDSFDFNSDDDVDIFDVQGLFDQLP